MAAQAGYKPSPLGYGSPRNSPFRRPESPSPASPSPLRQATPSATQPKNTTTSRLARETTPTSTNGSRTPRANMGGPSETPFRTAAPSALGHGNALSQLQPTQVRTLREGFGILDRDSDGVVNREDVADMLNQLGLPSGQAEVSQFFPPSAPQTMALAAFLNSLADTLAVMSPSTELLSALSAFDDDDSGQIDVAELRDALLHTAPEPGERALTAMEVDRVMNGFTGRRAFSKNSMSGGGLASKRGEVFKYQDFVSSIMGSNGAAESASADTAET